MSIASPQVRHIVLFAFGAHATQETIDAVCDRFCALPAAIDLIVAFEWGTNMSPEGLAQGYTHCFQLTFASEADRDAYLVHPVHREFVEMPKPGLEQTLVFDYWSS